VYEEQTAPVIDFYRKKSLLQEVEGQGEIEAVQSRILAVVEGGRKRGAGRPAHAATNGAHHSPGERS
jgi:hypothetical protein